MSTSSISQVKNSGYMAKHKLTVVESKSTRKSQWVPRGASGMQQSAAEATTKAFLLVPPPVEQPSVEQASVEQLMAEDALAFLGDFKENKKRERRYALGPEELRELFAEEEVDPLAQCMRPGDQIYTALMGFITESKSGYAETAKFILFKPETKRKGKWVSPGMSGLQQSAAEATLKAFLMSGKQ